MFTHPFVAVSLLPVSCTLKKSRKLSKLDEPDMQDTAGEAEMNS